jgi:hypothetical protein
VRVTGRELTSKVPKNTSDFRGSKKWIFRIFCPPYCPDFLPPRIF